MHLICFLIIAVWCGADAAASRCDSNPCQNDGVCKKSGPFICRCPDFVYGEFCEKSPCSSNPCKNGNKCTALIEGKFECSCPNGYFGDNCEIKMNTGTSSSSTQSHSKETNEEPDKKTSGSDENNDPWEHTTTIGDQQSVSTIGDQSTMSTSGIPKNDRTGSDSTTYSNTENNIETTKQTSPSDSSSTVSTSSPASDPTTYSTSDNTIEITNHTSSSDSSSTASPTENMTNTKSDETPTSTTQETSVISTDGSPATDPTTYSTSDDIEIINQTSPSDSSSTVSTTNRNEITSPISESTTNTSEQPVIGINDYTNTEDEFKTSEKSWDDFSRKFSTVSSTVEIKVISEERTKADITTRASDTAVDRNIKDDSTNDQISDKTRFSSSGGWAIGGSLLAIICLVSSGVYIVRRHRRSKFRNTEGYNTNSVMRESSNANQNHLV